MPPTKQLTMSIQQRFFGMLNYLEEVDPDYKRAGPTRRSRMLANDAYYEQLLLYEKRRKATQATLDAFFKRKASLLRLLPAKSLTRVTSLSQGPP